MSDAEALLAGPDAVKAVSGKRIHYATYYRWTQRGLLAVDGRRVRLEFVKAGSDRLTSVQAVRRFFSALTRSEGVARISSTPRAQQARDELAANGM